MTLRKPQLGILSSSSPLIGPLALGAVGPLDLLLQPGALLLQLQQCLWAVLLLAHQDDVLQEGLLFSQELHEVSIPIRLGPSRPALAIQLCKLMLDTLNPTRTAKNRQSNDTNNRFYKLSVRSVLQSMQMEFSTQGNTVLKQELKQISSPMSPVSFGFLAQ